jgi:large subunit ribosomal protein L30
MSKIKVTQVKSSIRRLNKQKKTLEALGLRGIRKSAVHENTPSFQGMLKVVSHLVETEEV